MLTGVAVGIALAWWLIKRPPKIVKWILHNKIKTLAILAAAYLGHGAIQKTIHRSKIQNEVQKIKQEVRSREARKNRQGKDTSVAFQKSKGNALKTLEKQATDTVIQNTLISSPKKDISACSGRRAAAAHVRMEYFIGKRAKESIRPDLSGMHTILIYQAENPENHVVLHVGFHAGSLDKERPYQVYESVVKTEKGIMPMIGQFNIQFTEVPDITLGVSADEKDVKLVNAIPNLGTISITKNQGRTALQVASDGTLAFLTEQKAIQDVFSYVNLEQFSPLKSQGFTPYNTHAGYQYPQLKKTNPIQFKTNNER